MAILPVVLRDLIFIVFMFLLVIIIIFFGGDLTLLRGLVFGGIFLFLLKFLNLIHF